jgi:hypothetical protein
VEAHTVIKPAAELLPVADDKLAVVVELPPAPAPKAAAPVALVPDTPVSAAVEAAHFDRLNAQLESMLKANERMVRLIRMQLFSSSIFVSFIRGIAMGFGWVIGTTLVVGVLIYFLQSFDSAPLVGQYVDRIIEYLEHGAANQMARPSSDKTE